MYAHPAFFPATVAREQAISSSRFKKLARQFTPTSRHLQGSVVILPRTDDPVDEDVIRFDGIENAITLIGSSSDAVMFVTGDKRKGARHVGQALHDVPQFVHEGDGARRVVLLDIVSDAFEVMSGP